MDSNTRSDIMLEKMMLIQKAMYDPYMFHALRRPMTRAFNSTLHEFATQKRNLILSIDGKTGSGKSIAAIDIAKTWSSYSGGKFDESHICFTSQEALELLNSADEKDVFIIDEQITIFGTGSDREKTALENIEATVRASQISLIYCSPEVKLHVHHYRLWTTGIINYKRGLNLNVLYDGLEKKPMGYVVTRYPELSRKFWESYNRNKMNFINAVLKQEPVDRTREYEKIAIDFVETKIIKEGLVFSSKSQLRTKLIGIYKKNFTNQEWITINHIIDDKCRNLDISPYTFTRW